MTDRTDPEPDPAARYAALPEPVRLADTITSQATTDAPDPTMGRDTETELMLRHA
ncbi:hypothetical protein [Cellulomonas fimi]|uniref:HemY domain-containing protein n=1 Tax=Cellulomonas fimi (strain ATCC 484 / DSM 20113 / JCM 1341 / CCUG 24087 / LMG 16345 / NBRC 15513 / NCIMB 8980 / NCTC 7547 / NRS-133) TaxID=590998 RepID=F4H704_CELFA|nr:hypothetical protein [Cellulomonas fimi]AEE44513.1 HemY domain-containing protein [Cellulomonas fimi ATCC 484]NNH06511.1 heme biosynthesis protein HemY [Cellulomonas fimi]VEH26511.1 Uncharacterised protein [Cellulomonas fimi]